MRAGFPHCLWLLLLGLSLFEPALADGAEEAAPDATQIVVRGRSKLAEALEPACHAASADGAARPLAFIVDVTPNTADDAAAFADALEALVPRVRAVPTWQVAALGRRFLKPRSSARALRPDIATVLGKETPVVSTVEALRASVKSLKAKAPVIVFLADWHFEDDADLESLLKDLKRKEATFSVVGSEAAFDRGWNDGIKHGSELLDASPMGFDMDLHFKGVGRSPFGRADHDAPWHGGESAYPHIAYRWHWRHWKTMFSAFDWELARLDEDPDDPPFGEPPTDPEELKRWLEDLRKRLPPGGGPPPGLPGLPPGGPDDGGAPPGPPPGPPPDDGLTQEEKNIEFPLPSAFGAYGMMRLAGMTGGRYVLYSFNPKGRRRVKYDYARCNLFPPDLRSRAEILKSLRGNPCARAMIEAWNLLAEADGDLAQITPPLKANARTPRSIDYMARATPFSYHWENRSAQKQFQRRVPDLIRILDRALKILDHALADSPEPPPGPERRYEAAARYFRHMVHVVRFELAEAQVAAKDVPADAWKHEDKDPGLSDRRWIRQGRDPERLRVDESMRPFDEEAGRQVMEERKALLKRFQGTPLGEQLALNTVDTCRPTWWRHTDELPETGRSPTESTDDKPKPPRVPGGPSGGGGPTTGR